MKDGVRILSPTEQALAIEAIAAVVRLLADYEAARYWPVEMENAPAMREHRLGADVNSQ